MKTDLTYVALPSELSVMAHTDKGLQWLDAEYDPQNWDRNMASLPADFYPSVVSHAIEDGLYVLGIVLR